MTSKSALDTSSTCAVHELNIQMALPQLLSVLIKIYAHSVIAILCGRIAHKTVPRADIKQVCVRGCSKRLNKRK